MASRLWYYETKEFVATLRRQKIHIISKPGFANWDEITPTIGLLADMVQTYPTSQILLLGCGHGALGVVLAQQVPQSKFFLVDTNFTAIKMAEKTLKLNSVTNAYIHSDISILPTYAESFDIVVMVLPKGREITRKWLVESYSALRFGGQMYLAGANREGIKSAILDMNSLFGNSTLLGYRKGERAAVAIKEQREPSNISWIREPGISPGTWHEFQAGLRGESLCLRTLPGIFSYDRIDEGTKLLLEKVDIFQGSNVLDVGCGYGIIGLLASRMGATHVDLVDIDLCSIVSARENIVLNDIRNAQAIPSDLLSEVSGRRYNIIVTNPPFHVGMSTDYEVARALIIHSYELLEPDGGLIVVANKFLRYDKLMDIVFGNVHCLAETNRYHLLLSRKRP